MASNYVEWDLQLYDKRKDAPIDDDTGLANILTAAAPTEVTIYSDDSGTSASNPLTMTNGVIRFFTASSTTSVDISVLTASGRAYFLEAVARSEHRVDVDTEQQDYQLIVPWSGNTASNVPTSTGFSLLAGMRVKDVFVHVTTAMTASALDIGELSGDTDGFLDNVIASVTGYRVGDAQLISSETASVSIVKSAQIRGTYLVDFEKGFSATATAGGSKGFFTRKYRHVTTATVLSYTVVATNSGGTGSGYIYVEYDLLPTNGN